MSKAIIATPTDGTKELIKDGVNGLVVPFNDVQAIVSAISQFYCNKSLMNVCSDTARKLILQRFSAQNVADSVSKIYQNYAKS